MRDVYVESPNLWVLNVMMTLLLVLFTQLPRHAEMARHHSKFGVRRFATVVVENLGESPPPEDEPVSRVRKDGGKSGEGKEKLPVELQQRID